MRYEEYIEQGIQIAPGVFNGLGQQLFGRSVKLLGSRWTKIGTN